jgi:exopolysaccharide production protein ExoQ
LRRSLLVVIGPFALARDAGHSTIQCFDRKHGSGMSKLLDPESPDRLPVPGAGSSGGAILRFLPAFVIFYTVMILPFFPDDGKGRVENILFWPILAMLVLALVFQNRSRVDYGFLRSVPIVSLVAYFVFAAASVMWAFSPDFAFSRLVVQVLAFIVVVLPYAVPTRSKNAIPGVFPCYVIALAISAIYVMTTPPSPIGHAGYFTHKQELGLLAAVGLILASYELLQRSWRSPFALVTIGLAFWLVSESESKSAFAFALFTLITSAVILLVCWKTRLTPAIIVATVMIASIFVSNPIERLGHRLYNDPTITGRTGIWGFVEYQISHKPWLGWGFHSYYFVPNTPHNSAPGYIRLMPSSHSGYLELKLETGRIGYWIFMVFVYSSLHLVERVRRKDPLRAWLFLSVQLFAVLINLLDSTWLTLSHFWILYLIVVAETIRYALSVREHAPAPSRAVRAVRLGLRRRVAPLADGAP